LDQGAGSASFGIDTEPFDADAALGDLEWQVLLLNKLDVRPWHKMQGTPETALNTERMGA
jgi:hypothetical protein